MTWVVGTSCRFGWAAGFGDIRVTFPNGVERDGIQKIHPVGRYIGAGFSGSVRIGFSMLSGLSQLLHGDEPGMAWDLSQVAEWWPQDARGIWERSPDLEKSARSELMLFGVDPIRGNPWAKPYVYVFRSPEFAPTPTALTGMLETCSIGRGAGIKTYCEAIQNLAADEDLIRLEAGHPAGIVSGIDRRITERLEALPIPGISPHLHVCIAFRDRINCGTNDRRYIGRPPETHFVMPPVARSYAEFNRMFGGTANAVEGATA